ncbi:MAG: CehA/McbA family metallohydrolase [Planctomycetota bacterium]|nr:CehA/McbA family metallohydrolase [Planctomycetota bacterium]
MKPYFGTLHAHSVLSGDVGNDKGFKAEEAFHFARGQGLDFLGVTDHHKPLGTRNAERFRMSLADYREQLFDVAATINADSSIEFVALPGIEWGTIGIGNHFTIFGAATLPVEEIKSVEYDRLIAWTIDNADFVQMNHPYSWAGAGSKRNKDVGNFGRALYASDSEFVEKVDPIVELMSIICTVAGGHISGQHRDSLKKTHRDYHPKAMREYLRHLDMGFHISPVANQDTHGKNPGAVTAARTGVWASELSYGKLIEGIKANRVFATEDDELAVSLRVSHGGQVYWMGETVPLGAEERDVTISVTIHQLEANGDPTDEGPYTVTVFSDADGIGGKKAAEWDTFPATVGTTEFQIPVVAGEYIFIQVTEEGGKDNPIGDGEDDELPEGRDDLNDSAWTTPVWFTAHSDTNFVWSRNSSLYHDHNCWAVQRIGAANRREGPSPSGRTKHNCAPSTN